MAIEIQSSTLNYLDSLSFISLFGAVILSHTQELSILCFFITLFAHATILYSMVPISFLIYGLLLLPRASQQFWLWIAAYTQIVMVLKFLYQLDIFCVGQYTDNNSQDTSYYYNIQPSWYCNNLNQGQIRFDQILGITKSEHSNDAVSILIADIVCLIFVAIHIMMLKKKGVWYETEHHYDNYIESWFKEYEKRHESYLQLEKEPAQNNKYDYDKIINGDEKNIQIIKRIGEPKRVYDCINDKFIENDQNYKDYDINKHRVEYVGLPVWDIYMFKFHSLIQNHLPKKIRMYFFELIPPSFRLLANSESICDEIKPGIDLYFWMFIIDIILLFWVLLFYSSMAEPKSVAAVTGSFSTSRFSGDMVYILFIQMMFMIFDRIVYLTNTLVLKLVCQFISVILFHYYIFVKWILNRNTFFYDNGFLVTYYLLRLIYWFLSCKQIAYGYPTFIRSHSRMSKRFTFFYYCFFTAYMAIPFVYEMRTILEWVCIPTTLQLFELMKVEDIYGQLFKVKCNITVYKQQRNRGEQIPMIKKFFQGGCVFIAIIAFLIVPLLLFSTSSPASTNNPVKDSQVTISINNIKGFGNLELLSLSNYRLEQSQVPLLLRPYFDATSQISQSIIFESDADSIFTVPTVLRDRVSEILGCLNSTNGQPLSPQACEQQLHDTHIELQYQFTRSGPDDNNPIKGIVYLSNQFYLTPPQGKQLSQVLNATNQNITSFLCPTPYAQWLRLPAQNDVSVYNSDINPLFNVTVTLITHEYESYWNIYPTLNFILISDNYVSSSLLSLTGVSSYSVVGFYAIVVYSFAQLLRLLYGDQVKEIIFQDLQNVDYILRIVTAVKLARNQRNYHLEELLYRKLIRIYRDPALIVTLTKRQDNTNSTTVDDISPHKSEKQSGLRNRKHKSNNNIVDDE
eukprot:424721_1